MIYCPSLSGRKAKIEGRHCALITNGPCVKAAGNFLNPQDAKYVEEVRLEPELKRMFEKLWRRCENNIKMVFKKEGFCIIRIHAAIIFGVWLL